MVRALANAVEQQGASRDELLARAGLPAGLLDRSESFLPVDAFTRVIDAALEITADPALGLHLGERARHGMFQLPAHLVQHAGTLGEAIDGIARFAELLAHGFQPRVLRTGSHVVLRFAFLSGEHASVRVMAELAMAGLLRLVRDHVGDQAYPERVSFAYPAPAHADAYRRLFGGRERFSQRFTQLQLPAAWLDRRQPHAHGELHALLRSHAEQQLALLQPAESLERRIEQLLAASDPRALPSMAEVARALHKSSRTLARQLEREGLTFAQLTTRRRCAAAQQLLEQHLLSVREVAERMGFADVTAFHKAWKRWTGLTPQQFRAGKRGRRAW